MIFSKSLQLRYLILCFLLITSAMTTQLFAGAWPQKQGGYYLKLTGTYRYTTSEFDYLGKRKKILEDFEGTFQDGVYRESTISIYGEYGLFPSLTLLGSLPVKYATSSRTEISAYFPDGRRESSFNTFGAGDIKLGAKWGVLRTANMVLTVQSLIKAPLYSNSSEDSGPQSGTGSTDIDLRLMSGFSISPTPLYFNAEIGYRWRSSVLHNEYFALLESGTSLHRFNFKTAVHVLKNEIDPPDIYGQTLQLPLPGGGGAVPVQLFGDQEFIEVILEGAYQIGSNWSLSLGINHILTGKNIITGSLIETGLMIAH